jgi:hypothetical protein
LKAKLFCYFFYKSYNKIKINMLQEVILYFKEKEVEMTTIFKSFRKISFLFIMISFSFVSQAFSQAETLTIATYYPAPMGVYENLRLFPIPAVQAPACNANQEGVMYYNNDAGENQLMVCRETAAGFGWEAIGASFWTQPAGTNDLYPNDNNWMVNIGANDPSLGGRVDSVFTVVTNAANTTGLALGAGAAQPALSIRPYANGSWDLRDYSGNAWNREMTGDNGVVTFDRLVVRTRAANPPNPRNGEIWVLQ